MTQQRNKKKGMAMKILVLNGSPRPKGNTAAMVEAFVEGAKENHHDVTVFEVCSKKSPDAGHASTAIRKEKESA